MIKADTEGFFKIIGIKILIGLARMFIVAPLSAVFMISPLSIGFLTNDLSGVVAMLSGFAVAYILVIFLFICIYLFTSILTYNLFALWIGQFNVGSWHDGYEIGSDISERESTQTKPEVVSNDIAATPSKRVPPKGLYDIEKAKVESRYHKKDDERKPPKGLYDIEPAVVESRYHEDDDLEK